MGFSGVVGRYVGDYGLIYERTIVSRHALVLQGGVTHAHGDPAHANIGSGRIGYRVRPGEPSERLIPYMGLLLGARAVAGGHEPVEGAPPTAHWSALGATGALHVGSYATLAGPLLLGTRVGLSGQVWRFNCSDAPAEACDAAKLLLASSLIGVDTELSLGIRF